MILVTDINHQAGRPRSQKKEGSVHSFEELCVTLLKTRGKHLQGKVAIASLPF